VAAQTVSNPSPAELAAYNAPYPSLIYKAAVRTFPSMVAAIERQNVPAWKSLGQFRKPFLFFGGEHDFNMGSRANQKRLTEHTPPLCSGCQGTRRVTPAGWRCAARLRRRRGGRAERQCR
jgi:hypothetical protein